MSGAGPLATGTVNTLAAINDDIDNAGAGTQVVLHRTGVATPGRVAVLKTKNTDANGYDGKDFVGNADSVATAGITNGTSFTWYLRVPAEVADIKRVRVAAVVVDTTASGGARVDDPAVEGDPVVKLSPVSEQFNIDGDRPSNPVSTTPFGVDSEGVSNAGPQNSGSGDVLLSTYAAPYTAPEDLLLFGELKAGATTVDVRKQKGKIAAGFKRGNSRVLGIGDSLHLRLHLGADAGRILLGDDEVAVKAFGKYLVADKDDNDNGLVQFDIQIADGQFGAFAGTDDTTFNHDVTAYVAPNDANNDGSIDPANEGESGTRNLFPATDTIRFGYIDPAGNFSGAIDGDESGAKAVATFFIDTKAPDLDAAKEDTIIPVSDDTITDGTLSEKDGLPSDTNTVVFKLAEALDSLFVTFDGADVDVSFAIPNSSSPPSINDAVLRSTRTWDDPLT